MGVLSYCKIDLFKSGGCCMSEQEETQMMTTMTIVMMMTTLTKLTTMKTMTTMATMTTMTTTMMMLMMMNTIDHQKSQNRGVACQHSKAEPNWNFIAFSTDLPAHHTNTISFGWATIMTIPTPFHLDD